MFEIYSKALKDEFARQRVEGMLGKGNSNARVQRGKRIQGKKGIKKGQSNKKT